MIKKLGVAFATAFIVVQAAAAPIAPAFDTFGSLPAATFGGSGIPNHAVAITTTNLTGSDLGITLAMSASQRFANPAVTNNGAGYFGASGGTDTNPPSPADPYARWNFNFYIASGAASIGSYNYALLYDFDPGVNTDQSAHGSIVLATLGLPVPSPVQDSYNLGMNFLAAAGVFGVATVTPPVPPVVFNPNSAGEYSFALIAYDSTGAEQGRAAIVVSVPEPGTLALLGIALLGFAVTRRRS